MIKSMTGFGRCEVTGEERKITVEMKSVNHRYLDVSIKMPKKLNFFESAIRSELKNYITRGKVDIFIAYEDYSEESGSLKYNKALAAEYLGYLRQMAEEFGLDDDVRVSTLSRYPEVFVMEEQGIDEEELWKRLLKEATRNGAKHFVCNAPWQAALFRDRQDVDLVAGPFCNAANAFTLAAFATQNFPSLGIYASQGSAFVPWKSSSNVSA